MDFDSKKISIKNRKELVDKRKEEFNYKIKDRNNFQIHFDY